MFVRESHNKKINGVKRDLHERLIIASTLTALVSIGVQ